MKTTNVIIIMWTAMILTIGALIYTKVRTSLVPKLDQFQEVIYENP